MKNAEMPLCVKQHIRDPHPGTGDLDKRMYNNRDLIYRQQVTAKRTECGMAVAHQRERVGGPGQGRGSSRWQSPMHLPRVAAASAASAASLPADESFA